MRILSLGAVLMDQIASVERFPGQDDEVYVSELKRISGGSAANFAVLCSRLGADTGFIGKVGKDSPGDGLIEDLRKEHVDTSTVMRADIPTGTVFVAVRQDGQRMMFAYSGAANDMNELELDLNYLNKFDHLHLADLRNIDVLEYAASKFKGSISLNAGALIAERRDYAHGLISSVHILICSEDEAKKLSGKTKLDDAMATLRAMGPGLIVVTRGPQPTLAFDGANKVECPTFKVSVVDATGAGDAFSAGFVYRYLETRNVQESLRFANATAAIVIQSPGARGGLVNRAQVERLSTSFPSV